MHYFYKQNYQICSESYRIILMLKFPLIYKMTGCAIIDSNMPIMPLFTGWLIMLVLQITNLKHVLYICIHYPAPISLFLPTIPHLLAT